MRAMSRFKPKARRAFQGECVAYVRANAASGKIKLTASATGSKSGNLVIKTSPELSR